MRLFFALMPPPALQSALAAAAAQVHLPHGRRVPATGLHVTLAFLGQVDAAARAGCERAGATIDREAFELSFDRAGCFERTHVAWLGPVRAPPGLTDLAADLRAALAAEAVRFDPQPFRCHLTIARDARAVPLPQRFTPVRWPVHEFALVESLSGSAGVRYEIRAKWPLRPARRDETAPPPVQ
jgi:2'-5' RNA ligase